MTRLTWDDLLIQDISPEDTRRWLEPWSGRIGGRLAVVFLNKFGSWFLHRPEGHIEMLDVLTGDLQKVAATYDEFFAAVNQRPWQETYLLSERVYELHERGLVPGPGQCYALVPHPTLGGPNPSAGEPLDPRFVMLMEVVVWQSLCAQVLGERA